MSFSGAVAQNKTQTASFGIWTLVAPSIYYDDNHYSEFVS